MLSTDVTFIFSIDLYLLFSKSCYFASVDPVYRKRESEKRGSDKCRRGREKEECMKLAETTPMTRLNKNKLKLSPLNHVCVCGSCFATSNSLLPNFGKKKELISLYIYIYFIYYIYFHLWWERMFLFKILD